MKINKFFTAFITHRYSFLLLCKNLLLRSKNKLMTVFGGKLSKKKYKNFHSLATMDVWKAFFFSWNSQNLYEHHNEADATKMKEFFEKTSKWIGARFENTCLMHENLFFYRFSSLLYEKEAFFFHFRTHLICIIFLSHAYSCKIFLSIYFIDHSIIFASSLKSGNIFLYVINICNFV